MAENPNCMPKPCERSCPKCGSADVARQFHKAEVAIVPEKYNVSPLPGWCSGSGHRYWATRDLIHHHCRTCQFGWVGKPLGKNRKLKPAEDLDLQDELARLLSAALDELFEVTRDPDRQRSETDSVRKAIKARAAELLKVEHGQVAQR